MKLPETLLCKKCKKDLPLDAFHFVCIGKQEIHPTEQCNACRFKQYSVKQEAKSVYLCALWKLLGLGLIWPYELDYELRRRYDTFTGDWSKLKPHFDILDRPTDEDQEAIIFLHLRQEVENEVWDAWLNGKYFIWNPAIKKKRKKRINRIENKRKRRNTWLNN